MWVRRIQYDGEGGGRGSHTWRTEMAKMPAQHIQIYQAGQGGSYLSGFLALTVQSGSNKLNIFIAFTSFMVRLWLQHMHACLCASLHGVQQADGYHICMLTSVHPGCFCSYACVLILTCATHISEHVFMSVFHTKKLHINQVSEAL